MTEDQSLTDTTTMSFLLTPNDSANLLLSLTQDGCLIKDYMEDFLELSHQVAWSNDTIKTEFWSGLDDPLFKLVPATATTCSLRLYVDYVLWLSGSSLIVGEVAEDTITTQLSPLSLQSSKHQRT